MNAAHTSRELFDPIVTAAEKIIRERKRESSVPARFVLIGLAAKITGLTPKAIKKKIERKVWQEGHEYKRAPDGHIYVDLEGYAKWIVKKP